MRSPCSRKGCCERNQNQPSDQTCPFNTAAFWLVAPPPVAGKNPPVIEDLFELIEVSKVICVSKIIDMLRDLRNHGLESRYS
jgi:hypothetical protein